MTSNLESKTCGFCQGQYIGWGNNGLPVYNGRVCDGCNSLFVLPARIAQIYSDKKQKGADHEL